MGDVLVLDTNCPGPGIVLPLPGSVQCNGINLIIITKEQSIL